MAASHENAMTSSACTLACVTRHCIDLFQIPSPSEVTVAPCSPDAGSTTFTDTHDASSPPHSTTSSTDGGPNDVASRDIQTFGMVQLKIGFVLLYQMVAVLIVQVAVIASDVVSLKDRIVAAEGTQTPALAREQETAALARLVSELRERVAIQEDRIAYLERSQCLETESYKKTIQELTTKLDSVKVDENFCQSFKNLQRSMECQAARITGVKADTARKIALLQSELAGVQAELATAKMVTVPANAASTNQVAKDAQRAWILECVVRRIEAQGNDLPCDCSCWLIWRLRHEIEKLCPLPPIATQSLARVAVSQDMSAASTSSGGSPITLSDYSK